MAKSKKQINDKKTHSPLELAFAKGNYRQAQQLARAILAKTDTDPQEINWANHLLFQMNNEALAYKVGVLGVIFAALIAYWSIN